MRPWQPAFVARTLTILGGSIAALYAAVTEHGIAGNLAGGSFRNTARIDLGTMGLSYRSPFNRTSSRPGVVCLIYP